MPLTMFNCPDGKTRPIAECLECCPRPEGRCMALGNLIAASSDRKWEGKPSVTQLIKPTRIAFLEIKCDYAVDPDDRAFMMLGVWHHQRLAAITEKLAGLTEKRLEGDISGTLDRLESDELNEGHYKLLDYKTSGTYTIAKALGLKSGNGDPDMKEWELQLNYYRILLESDPELGKLFPISRLFIQATVRDGGLAATKDMGVERKMPLIPARKLDDGYVKDYFEKKRAALLSVLEKNKLPEMCGWDERWGNRRCKGFCSVVSFCPEGAKMARIEYKGG